MFIDLVVWDDEDDPRGNVQHIADHDLTVDEVEEVLLDPRSDFETSDESGNPMAIGWTSTGKHIAVIFVFEDDPELIIVHPRTAYAVPEYGG
jgi:uncharacterized DUF497 family protein